ncbi:MAG: CDGSH iron-sulfur domain-containing protein [Gemmatimonadota bacterium]|nr:CDGSH iron-sulfur domain-containing protein [Gemmatimonadota bacterium]
MDVTTITVTDNGPYMVEGPARVIDAEGNAWEVPGPKVWLCRCGQSSNRPFCDGTHNDSGFEGCERADD